MKSFSVFSILILCFLIFISCGSKEMNKAKEYMDAHMYNEAISLLDIEIQTNPKNVEAYYLAAQCYLELDNIYQAEEYFEKAILLDTDYRTKIGQIYYEKAFKLYTENNFAVAEPTYNKALQYDPVGKNNFAQRLFDYATDISATSTKSKDVTNIYNFVTSIDNQFNEEIAKKCAVLSTSLYDKGFYEQSFDYGEFSIKYDPGFINQLSTLYSNYATKLLEVPTKSYEAINYFDRSLTLNVVNKNKIANVYYDYSQKYITQNNIELALLFAEKSSTLDSKYEKYFKEISNKNRPKISSEGIVNNYHPYKSSTAIAFEWPNGTEISFNGYDDYYQTNDKVLNSSNFSFEIILSNSSSNQSLDATIFSNQNDDGCYGLIFANRSGNSNGYSIFYGDGNNNWVGIDIDRFSIPVDRWTHYIFVKRDNMTYLYENGELKYQRSQSSSYANFNSCNDLTFARCPFRSFRFWKGSIKLSRFWNRSLSDMEISSLFNRN